MRNLIIAIVALLILITTISLVIDRGLFYLRYKEFPTVIDTKEYFIEIQFPKSWEIFVKNKNNYWLSSYPSNKETIVNIYTFYSDHRISVNQVLTTEKELIPLNAKHISDYEISFPFVKKLFQFNYKGIDRIYSLSSHEQLLVRYFVSSTYAYVVLVKTKPEHISFYREYLSNNISVFNKHVFYSDVKNIFNNYHEILIWIAGAIIALFFWIGMGVVGLIGLFIRENVEMLKSLKKIKKDAFTEGKSLNEKFYTKVSSSRFKITITFVLILAFYGIGFYYFRNQFLPVLFLLCFPVLGYFGILFGPSKDVNDWLH